MSRYDKLFVDNKLFVWSEVQGKVVAQATGETEGTSPCPCSRPASVMADSAFARCKLQEFVANTVKIQYCNVAIIHCLMVIDGSFKRKLDFQIFQ